MIITSHIALDFGHADRVQDLGVVVDAEGSHHLSLVLLKLLLVFNLEGATTGCQVSIYRNTNSQNQ